MPRFFVAQVHRLSARIADRIVVPRREPEQMRVLAPRVAEPAFRHDAAEARVGNDIDPWRGRCLSRAGRNDVFASIRRESSDAVEQDEIVLPRGDFAGALRPVGVDRSEPRDSYLGGYATVDLVGQRPAAVDDDRAGDRLEQRPVFGGNLLGVAHENAAGPIDEAGFDARSDQPQDLLLQPLPVDVVIFVPDDQVDRQSLQTPVGVCLHELPYKVDVAGSRYLQQHDRQVAGNRVAPQPGLPAAIPDQNTRGCTQRCIAVDDRTGKAAIQLRIGFGGVELLQHHLAVRPGQLEHAIHQAAILIFIDQTQYAVARLTGT